MIGWGGYGLSAAVQITGVDFSQQIHNRLGGQENVNTWNKAYFVYRTMKFNPSLIERMEIGEDELGFLLKSGEFKNYRRADGMFTNPERNQWIRQFSVFLLSQKDTELAQDNLIRVSGDNDVIVRRIAVASLGERETEAAQNTLIEALDDSDGEVRRISRVSLGRYGSYDYRAVGPLMNALQYNDWHKHPDNEAAAVLMAIDDPLAKDSYVEGLESYEGIVRTISAFWLAGLKDPETVAPLIEALKKEDDIGFNYESAPRTLEELFEVDYKQMSPVLAEALAVVNINGPDSTESLIEIAVSGENMASRQASVIALGLMGDSQAIEPLIGLLNDPVKDIRALSVLALGNFNAPEVKEALYKTLNNEKEVYSIRLKAAGSLVELGEVPEGLVPELIHAIETDDYYSKETQQVAMEILGRVKQPEAFSFVRSYWQNGQANAELRLIGAISLAGAGGGENLEFLDGILDGSIKVDSRFRDRIIYNLGKTGNIQAVEPLKIFLANSRGNSFQTNALAVASLNKIDPVKTEQILLDVFPRNQDAQFRRVALLGLADSAHPKAIEFGLSSLKYEQPEMRYASLSSLANKINEPVVKTAFIDLIKHDNDPFVKSQAIFGLRNSNDLEVAEILKFTLNDPYPQVKAAAISTLALRADFDTINKIAKFSSDPNLMVRRTATASLGQRLTDFPQNADYLIPKLKDNDWPTKQMAMSSLGANINKFPQLKEPFLKIAKDNTQPFIFQQSALASLSKIQAPEIKDLLVGNLNHPDWRMRQTAALGLGNFKDTDIIPSLKPLLNDKQWQVRQATVDTFSKFNEPQTIELLIPKLKDTSLQVRQTSILPLVNNLKTFPELRQPLMNTFQDKSEDLWVRQIAGASLNNAGYSVDFDLEGIKPLGKTMAIFMPGLDNPNPFDVGRPQGEDWLRNDKIGQDFYKLEKIGLAEVDMSDWSGNIQDMGKAGRDFSKKMEIDYSKARNSKMDSVTFIGHSAGGLYSDEGINHFKTLDDEYLKVHPYEERIKINILVGGSPLILNDKVFHDLAESTGGQYKPVWSPVDPLSWPVAFKPNSQMILSRHQDYFNNLEFRQTALSMSIGRDIPISYSRTAYGSISDQYFSATYKIQQIKSVYSSGITTYQTKEWYTYRSGRQLIPSNLYNRISPLPPIQPIRQVPSYSLPSRPAIPAVGRRP